MKKVTLTFVLVLAFALAQTSLFAGSISLPGTLTAEMLSSESKYDTARIQTSAVCNMCKERLEHDMAYEKGVKAVELDMETKVLTIVYKKDKTTVEELRKAITMIGYDADGMVADVKAHDRLPACCKKDVEPH